MNDPKLPKNSDQSGSAEKVQEVAPPVSPAGSVSTEKVGASQQLSAEEQMALFEKELKENDWGHQPC